MDTEGPISVLDQRARSTSRDRIIADRITRQRSPGPAFCHGGGRVSKFVSSAAADHPQEVIYRIPQPYRTSFSAKHSVTWAKVDRSRSLSPTSSLRSDFSCSSVPPSLSSGRDKHCSRGHIKYPKRVTYDSRVMVRHSDTEDSVVVELSSYQDEEVQLHPNMSPFRRSLISPKYNEFSQLDPNPGSPLSPEYPEHQRQVIDITNLCHRSLSDQDTQVDYSGELLNITDQILRMDWSPKQTLKMNSSSKTEYQCESDKNASLSASPSTPSSHGVSTHLDHPQGRHREVVGSDSQIFSPGESRSHLESGRLTLTKRSVSLSITNLLKRVSPHFRKKYSKDSDRKSSSTQNSVQSLTNVSDTESASGHLSRNRVYQSLFKLVGKSGSRSKKTVKSQTQNGHYATEMCWQETETHNVTEEITNECASRSDKSERTGFMNIESDTPIHSHDLLMQSSPHQNMDPATQDSLKADTNNERMDFFTEFDINAILQPSLATCDVRIANFDDNASLSQPKPPTSLEVMPARTKRLLQTSVMSSISGDESIGDCSLDANLTASEPSLLSGASQSGASRQVMIPHSLISSCESQLLPESNRTEVRRTSSQREDQSIEEMQQAENTFSESGSLPSDCHHKPSYLKLSCAVSGYGGYSQYSKLKDVSKSPSSSQNSICSHDSSTLAGVLQGDVEDASQNLVSQDSVVLSHHVDYAGNTQ